MRYPNCIDLQFSNDYKPLIEMIDAVARECKSSRNTVIRNILCHYFEFQPKKAMHSLIVFEE